MPKYSFKLKNGKTMDVEGANMPSDSEVEALAKENGVELQLADTAAPPTPTNTPVKSVEPVAEPQEDEGWLSKAWHAISEPMTDLPSRMAKGVADYVDTPDPNSDDSYMSGAKARLKGFMAGATQGAGDILSDLTSPINLATAALSGGSNIAAKQGLSTTAHLMDIGSRISGAPVVAHGASELLSPESDWGTRGRGLLEIAGGLVGMHGKGGELPLKEGEVVHNGASVQNATVNPQTGETVIPGITNRIKDPVDPNMAGGMGDPELAGSEPYKPKTMANDGSAVKVGATILVDGTKASKNFLKEATEQGFVFDGLNDQGKFKFKKVSDPATQPVLESEVGSSRPRMGPVVDAKKNSVAGEILNLPRTIMASTDMSAPLRQGIGLIHKPEFWKAVPDMFRAWGSEDAFNEVQKVISEKPLFKQRINPKTNKPMPSFAEDAGLKLTDLLNKREESIMSSWAEKVPGVRRSNRAYTAFLNKLRADTFESLVKDGKVFGANAEVDIPLARALADFVNTATGRGSLKSEGITLGNHTIGEFDLESSANLLNSTLFAPRLIASRLRMLDPRLYLMGPPQVRKEAIKSLISIAGIGTTLGQLAKIGGIGTVSGDSTSPDFGKIKIGKVRIDPFAGFQQYVVLASRFIHQQSTTSNSEGHTGKSYDLMNSHKKPFDPTNLSVGMDFLENKSNPALSFAIGMARGKGKDNRPFDIPEELASRFTPLFLQDLKELLTENPNLVPGIHKEGTGMFNPNEYHPENLPAAVPAFFGMGVQQY